jgi:hypothetical protein
MPFGWLILIIGVVSGAALGTRGLLIPAVVEVGWWLERGISLGFFNHTGYGDNVGAERLLLVVAGLALGFAGVLAGCGLRALIRRARIAP